MKMKRRGFFGMLAAAIAAPAVVKGTPQNDLIFGNAEDAKISFGDTTLSFKDTALNIRSVPDGYIDFEAPLRFDTFRPKKGSNFDVHKKR